MTRKILLTNDDGIYAPGLAAMAAALKSLGEVFIVAPAREQSGVSHTITFLIPLTVKNVFIENQHWGWAVDGTPADCVKLGISKILPDRPDVIVSGINGGLNAGANILYSGTVGAAMEGAYSGITSFAVSLEYLENEPYHQAARLATHLIEQILDTEPGGARMFNLNIPLAALRTQTPKVRVTKMDTSPHWVAFEERTDPVGRSYYWLTGRPDPQGNSHCSEETDLQAIREGEISVTPLQFDLTDQALHKKMNRWNLQAMEHTEPAPDLAAHSFVTTNYCAAPETETDVAAILRR